MRYISFVWKLALNLIRTGRLVLLKKIVTLTLTLFELPFNRSPFSWEGVSCKGLREINQRKAFVSLSSHSQELCESRPEDGGDRFFCDTFMRSEEKTHTHTLANKTKQKTVPDCEYSQMSRIKTILRLFYSYRAHMFLLYIYGK